MLKNPDSFREKPSFSIILFNTEHPGNIGSVCRLMKNFGFAHLILFNPLCDWKAPEALAFAMHGRDILENVEVIQCNSENVSECLRTLLNRFTLVIATSAKGLHYRNIKRVPLFVDELKSEMFPPSSHTAVLFGRESTGLTNEQILLADFSVKIPTGEEYPTLNLSHAVGIVLFTLFKKIHKTPPKGFMQPASRKDKEVLLSQIKKVSDLSLIRDYKKERTLIAFKNLIGRAFISKKECSLLTGFFGKIVVTLKKKALKKKEEKKK